MSTTPDRKGSNVSFDRERLAEVIKDVAAHKRVIKWGYMRAFGGLHAAECDTVASHSSAVSILASILAHEFAEDLEYKTGVRVDVDEVLLLATFHDFGEGRSGDTGAASHAVRGFCNLHGLEREGLEASVKGLRLSNRILKLFDDYRKYSTPEAVLVHIADNLEGFEKAVHSSRGSKPILAEAVEIMKANIHVYQGKSEVDEKLGEVCSFMVREILVPSLNVICEKYDLKEEFGFDAIQ